MGSNLNFQNFITDPPPETGGGRPPGVNFPLSRQHSVYSLTFDEFQSTVGGIGKDFGSMNMDELLKNIWSAEENQIIGSTSGNINGQNIQEGSGYLQRQGSLTLPRTLSQKTVDEVWRDLSKDQTGSISGFGAPHKQPTLGEITLEEFLVRAGVVKEDAQLAATKPKNVGFLGDFSRPVNNNSGFEFGYQNQQQGRGATTTAGLMGGRMAESSSNQVAMQSANLLLNVNGARSAGATPQQHTVQPPSQPQILPKQPTLSYGAAMGVPSSLGSPGMRAGIMGISDGAMNDGMIGGMGVVGLGVSNGVSVPTGSPAVSSDGLTRSNGDTSSVSPVPYVFNGGLRGRKSAALEKVVERRQRRMIKNRESAARSRARKQAYTMELEAEVAKLKEENEELRKKQDEMMEIQKNQVMEMMKEQKGNKRRCLRRTQTGPW